MRGVQAKIRDVLCALRFLSGRKYIYLGCESGSGAGKEEGKRRLFMTRKYLWGSLWNTLHIGQSLYNLLHCFVYLCCDWCKDATHIKRQRDTSIQEGSRKPGRGAGFVCSLFERQYRWDQVNVLQQFDQNSLLSLCSKPISFLALMSWRMA